jgi:hypothetical protein
MHIVALLCQASLDAQVSSSDSLVVEKMLNVTWFVKKYIELRAERQLGH